MKDHVDHLKFQRGSGWGEALNHSTIPVNQELGKVPFDVVTQGTQYAPFRCLEVLIQRGLVWPIHVDLQQFCNRLLKHHQACKIAQIILSTFYPLENLILVSRIKGVDSMDFRFNKTFQSAAWESSLEFMVFSISNRMSVRKMHGGAWSWPCQRWGTQPCICYKRILWFVHCFQVPGCQIGLMEMPTPQNLIQYTWATHNPACSLISISHICHQRLGEMDFSQIDHRTQDLKQWLQSSAFCAATLASLSSQCDCNFEVWSQMFRNYPFACTCHKAL